MAIFYPDFLVSKVIALTPQTLHTMGISALLLDVDNTLTTHNNPHPYEGVTGWIDSLQQAGIALVIVSNNSPQRVAPFAQALGVPYVANGAKPLPKGYRQAVELLGLAPAKGQVAAVGDQIFTDIIGGNLLGITTIMVTEITPEQGRFFRLKRWLERRIMTPKRMGRIAHIR